jgi:hypothetical protein
MGPIGVIVVPAAVDCHNVSFHVYKYIFSMQIGHKVKDAATIVIAVFIELA